MAFIEMKLNAIPFSQIDKGEKSVEVRLFDEKRSKLKVGDTIRFYAMDDDKRFIDVRIVALHRYDSFEELFKSPQFSKCGFGDMNASQAAECMGKYYTKEQQQKYGALGIEIVKI